MKNQNSFHDFFGRQETKKKLMDHEFCIRWSEKRFFYDINNNRTSKKLCEHITKYVYALLFNLANIRIKSWTDISVRASHTNVSMTNSMRHKIEQNKKINHALPY